MTTEPYQMMQPESALLTFIRRLSANPQGVIAIAGLGLLVTAAAGANAFGVHDPNAQDATGRLLVPSLAHPFGTDEFRRDLFARTIFGLRASLLTSLVAVSLGASVGICAGFVAGYIGGIVEGVMMRMVDAMLAFPGLLTALAVITILGPGAASIAAAIALLNIPAFSRLSRAQMLAERSMEYVVAARAVGLDPVRIIFRHIARNALPPLLTQVALAMVAGVLLEAALSFLGLGQRPPDPSLGNLILSSRNYLRAAWWYAVFPGGVLVLLLLCLNFLADAVNEATSPYAARRA